MRSPGSSRPHILIIDDSPEELRALVRLLGQEPWQLSQASNAQQGYQRALALRPDLILLDVRMPGMDGFTVCRLLREAPATCRIPIIFLTSANAVDERLEGLSLGSVDYVLKSCEPQEVLARIRIHLQLAWRDSQPVANAGSHKEESVSGDEVLLRATMRFIEQRLDDMPGLCEIARKVGTHEKRLSNLFRSRLGMTVFGYIREARLQRGRELLADSAMEIQDIASVVGFRSACNFTTAFRERTGMTPSQFRMQVKPENG